MGSSWQNQVRLEPCPNCQVRDGYMGSSEWDHDYMCCSKACGIRLGHRIKYGFRPGLKYQPAWRSWYDTPTPSPILPEPSSLRIEIKKLRHRLKTAQAENK